MSQIEILTIFGTTPFNGSQILDNEQTAQTTTHYWPIFGKQLIIDLNNRWGQVFWA